MRRSTAAGLMLVLTALLGGCAGQPYLDVRREAGQRIKVGPSNDDVVAICHAGTDAPPEVLKMAESECARTGRVPRYETRTRFTCALRTPTRSYFRCVPKDAPR